MPPTLKKWGAYLFRLVRSFVCSHKQMGTPVAIKFGQLDTQVVIFEYKCDLFRKFDTLVAKIDSCVSKPHIGKKPHKYPKYENVAT